MHKFWPTEIFNSIENFIEYCKKRYPNNFKKVIDEKKVWRIYAGKYQIDHPYADKLYWSKAEYNEYYGNNEAYIRESGRLFPHKTNEIWTTIYP